jgi:hypothetical protein
MENQTDLKDLLAALCKAQAEYPDIPKTRTGQEGNRKFKYADLNDIHKATRQINAKHGLTTPHETTDTHLITRLFHAASGQSLSTALPIKLTENPKHTGATLTYLKRYNIQSLLDISTEEDLDSIDLSKPTQENYKPPIKPPVSNQIEERQNQITQTITEPQLKRLFAIAGSKQWTHEQIKFYMIAVWSLESTKDLDREKYDKLVGIIETQSYIQAIKAFHDNKKFESK